MEGTPVAKPSPVPRLHVPRRGITVVFLLGAILVAAIVVLAFAWPGEGKVTGPAWVEAGGLEDLSVNEPVRFPEYRLWLVKLADGRVLALSQRSPYLGCTIPWRADFEFMGRTGWFRDPCHGDTYDLTGRCFAGPCPRGMDRYTVRVEDGRVRVSLKQLLPGPTPDFSGQPLTP